MSQFTFQGTEIYSKEFTRRYFIHSYDRYGATVSRQYRSYEDENAEEKMAEIHVYSSSEFEVIEESNFNGKVTYKKLPVKELVYENDEQEDGENA